MDIGRWKRVKNILAEALSLPTQVRGIYVAKACANAPDLLGEVQSLLRDETVDTDAIILRDISKKQMILYDSHSRLGPYIIEKELGQGGMGVVYLAWRVNDFKKKVAIKVMKPILDDGSLWKHFQKEQQILADLHHPYIASILDAGTTPDGLPYFVMEYVVGTPIDRYCKGKGLTLEQILSLFQMVIEAVSYAHHNKVIHRDIKPSNILVTREGHPVLLDFGIAGLLDTESRTIKTSLGHSPMTLAYASPEQVGGEQLIRTSDVYSLGVMLHELISGCLPYPARDYETCALLRAIMEGQTERPSESLVRMGRERLARMVRGDIDIIVSKALQRNPRKRYASADAFSEDIRCYLTGFPLHEQNLFPMVFAMKFLARYRCQLAAVVIFSVLLSGAILISWQCFQQEQIRRTQAEDLMSYMLVDLTSKLEKEGKQGVLDKVVDKTLSHFESFSSTDLSKGNHTHLAETLRQAGQIRYAQKNFHGALDAFGKLLAITQKGTPLVNIKDLSQRAQIANSHFWLSATLTKMDRKREAATSLRKSAEIYEGLIKSEPNQWRWRYQTAQFYRNAAQLMEAMNKNEIALSHYRRALQEVNWLLEKEETNQEWRSLRANNRYLYGRLAQEYNHEIAREFLIGASDDLKYLLEDCPGSLRFNLALASTFLELASINLEEGSPALAKAMSRQAKPYLEKARWLEGTGNFVELYMQYQTINSSILLEEISEHNRDPNNNEHISTTTKSECPCTLPFRYKERTEQPLLNALKKITVQDCNKNIWFYFLP